MGFWDWSWKLSKNMLGRNVSKSSLLAGVGSFAVGKAMRQSRLVWLQAEKQPDVVLDLITAYDVARGAGKLLDAWLCYEASPPDLDAIEKRFEQLLKAADPEDKLPEDQARTRLLLSKALYYLEGFRLSQCRYEDLQVQARQRLRKNPKWRNISRRDVFLAKPFEPEELIGSTHRLLLLLSEGQPKAFLQYFLNEGELRDDADYLARLIALTFEDGDANALTKAITDWCCDYRDFKLHQVSRREGMVNTGITAATGGLPFQVGMDLLKRGAQAALQRKAPRKK